MPLILLHRISISLKNLTGSVRNFPDPVIHCSFRKLKLALMVLQGLFMLLGNMMPWAMHLLELMAGGIFNSADPEDESLKKVYGCLKNIGPFIQGNRGTDNMSAMFISDGGQNDKLEMGDYTVSMRRFSSANLFKLTGGRFGVEGEEDKSAAGLIVIKLQDNEFLVAGGIGGVVVSISKAKSSKFENVGYASVDEISYENGKMLSHRLNGDETAMGGAIIKPGEVKIFKIKMYGY